MSRDMTNLSWAAIEGRWERVDADTIQFCGGEYDPQNQSSEGSPETQGTQSTKYVEYGVMLCDEKFKDGEISVEIEFSKVDHRSTAEIIIQYNTETKDFLSYGVTGGALGMTPQNSGYMYKLRNFGQPFDTGQNSIARNRGWTSLFEAGTGYNIKEDKKYRLSLRVSGQTIILYLDGVEIGRKELAVPSLPGYQCGIMAGTVGEVKFRNFQVSSKKPLAFVVMQFGTEQYESLFSDVIEPACNASGVVPYRADFTFLPGLIIEDIKSKIRESRIIIAEISPDNPNVYFEIGYADALGKPIILISDQKEGMKPFDVRAYRTIFYENSIKGKSRIESDLRTYLTSILSS